MAMEMRGSLNVSSFKKTEAQPGFYGRALINGVEYNIKGWEKEGKNGPWISLLFEDPADGFDEKPKRNSGIFSNSARGLEPGEIIDTETEEIFLDEKPF